MYSTHDRKQRFSMKDILYAERFPKDDKVGDIISTSYST